MRVSTDDEIYRVNGVWLGPPETSWPFRARYVAWGVWFVSLIGVFALLRQVFSLSLFIIGWSLIISIAITKVIVRAIDPERPLRAVVGMAAKELNTPRRPEQNVGGAASVADIRVRANRPRPPAPAVPSKFAPHNRWPAHREEVFRA